jgi:hypothetical protein
MSSHKLEVEQGRYYNVAKNKKICKMCSKSEIEDEFNFLLVCPWYNFRKIMSLSNKSNTSIKELRCNRRHYGYNLTPSTLPSSQNNI